MEGVAWRRRRGPFIRGDLAITIAVQLSQGRCRRFDFRDREDVILVRIECGDKRKGPFETRARLSSCGGAAAADLVNVVHAERVRLPRGLVARC